MIKIIILLVVFLISITILYIFFLILYYNYENKKKTQFNNDLKSLISNDIYNKLKYIKPNQISVLGTLDLETIKKSVEDLTNEYKRLINSKNNEDLLKKIENIKQNNDNLNKSINKLNEILIEKNKILDELIPNSNNQYTTFVSNFINNYSMFDEK